MIVILTTLKTENKGCYPIVTSFIFAKHTFIYHLLRWWTIHFVPEKCSLTLKLPYKHTHHLHKTHLLLKQLRHLQQRGDKKGCCIVDKGVIWSQSTYAWQWVWWVWWWWGCTLGLSQTGDTKDIELYINGEMA